MNLVRALMDLGLTLNQAKVYLSIVKFGAARVNQISEITQIHRQDIYKILPKLEETGLITKTIKSPLTIKTVPVKESLTNLVEIEKRKANERASLLEGRLKELINTLKKDARHESEEADIMFTLLSTKNQIVSITNLTLKNTKIECDLVTDIELITREINIFCTHFKRLLRKGVKIRIIVENQDNNNMVKIGIKKLKLATGDLAAKFVYENNPFPYWIIDNKEAWIFTKKVIKSGLHWVLRTNDGNIVQFYKKNFEKAWYDHSSIDI